MGRVAKYKKVKACDPFARSSTKAKSGLMMPFSSIVMDPTRKRSLKKKSRREKRRGGKKPSDKYDGFDAPPQDHEQDDFDLADPLLTVKNTGKLNKLDHGLEIETSAAVKPGKRIDEIMCHVPQTDKEEARVARILKLKQPKDDLRVGDTPESASAQTTKVTTEGRREGESMTAFKKRLSRETREALIRSKLSSLPRRVMNPEKLAKKKAFLEKRKLLKKGRRRKTKQNSYEDDDDYNENSEQNNENDQFVTGERAVAQMKVGLTEQVKRPPIFNVLPRGAKPKTKPSPQANSNGMNEAQEARERRAMEMIREKVIASYAQMKAKRKNR